MDIPAPEEVEAIAAFVEAHAALWAGRPTLPGILWCLHVLGYRKSEAPLEVPPAVVRLPPPTPPVDALFSAGVRQGGP